MTDTLTREALLRRALAGGAALSIPGLLPSLINPPVGCRFHPRCKFAWQLCVDQEPGLDPVGEGHLAACHLNTTTPPRKEVA